MHDYWIENMPNDIFHFSVSIAEFKFLSIDFSHMRLFHHFYSKIVSNAHFVSVSSNIGRFNKKTKNVVRFIGIKIRISIHFMHLGSKWTSEICQKAENLDWKTKKNHLKNANFFSKNCCIYWKTIKAYRFLL